MRSILNPPSRETRKFFQKRRCPLCGKKFASEPRFVRHVFVEFTMRELRVSWAEAEHLWDTHGRSLIKRDGDGNRIIQLPDEDEGGMNR